MHHPHHVDLSGCTTVEEAKAKVAALIAERQEDFLADYEITLVDHGVTDDELRCELAYRRTEMETVREELLARLRAFVKHGGKMLQ